MTNAEQIYNIKEHAEALRSHMEQMYGELPDNPLHDAEYIDILRKGLKLKKEADIFTEEERAFFDEIDKADEEARQILSDLFKEKAQIEKAEKTEAFYATSLRVLSLSELAEENASDTEIVTSVITDLLETRTLSTGIGWPRYEAMLKGQYKRTIDEAKAIVRELQAVKFLENGKIKLEFPNALYIKYETEYYTAESLVALPDKPTYEVTEETLKPLLYHHRKALEESNYSSSALETAIHSKSKKLATTAKISIDSEAFSSRYTTAPSAYTFTKDKVSNSLTKLEKGTQEVGVESQKDKKKGKEITTLVTLDFDELANGEKGIKRLKSLDIMDRELLNAVVSVWESAAANGEIVNGEATTTLQTLYRILTKNPGSRLDNPEKEKELSDRLMKLNAANIAINAEAEFDTYPALKKGRKALERRGSLVSIVIDKATVNGNTVYNTVRIMRLDRSPLYTYAKLKGHIASVPLKLLDTKAVNKNDETIAIEGYLIRRIEAIERISNGIVIDTLLEEVGIHEKDYKDFRGKRFKVIRKIDELLAGYVSTGYIKKYEFKAKGRIQYYKVNIYK